MQLKNKLQRHTIGINNTAQPLQDHHGGKLPQKHHGGKLPQKHHGGTWLQPHNGGGMTSTNSPRHTDGVVATAAQPPHHHFTGHTELIELTEHFGPTEQPPSTDCTATEAPRHGLQEAARHQIMSK